MKKEGRKQAAFLFADDGEEHGFLSQRSQGESIMDTLRSTAHLQRELGDELFAALINSDNTETVRKFAKELLESTLPSEIVVGGRTYEVLGFLREGESSVSGSTMVGRAIEMDANLGKDDGQHLLDNQQDIPAVLRKVVLVFTDWHYSVGSVAVGCVCWDGGRWFRGWRPLDRGWDGGVRVLRRK